MRYFEFTLECVTKTGTRTVSRGIAHPKFPSLDQVERSADIGLDDGIRTSSYVIIFMFEFKSKEDYESHFDGTEREMVAANGCQEGEE